VKQKLGHLELINIMKKNKSFEITNKLLTQIIQGFVIAFIFIYIIKSFFFESKLDTHNRIVESIMNEEYKGVVINRYYDVKNHNTPKIVFSNNTEIPIYGQFYSMVKNGDSIVKKKDESVITVYRGNETIILDNLNVIK
jgi:hypothetical protein